MWHPYLIKSSSKLRFIIINLFIQLKGDVTYRVQVCPHVGWSDIYQIMRDIWVSIGESQPSQIYSILPPCHKSRDMAAQLFVHCMVGLYRKHPLIEKKIPFWYVFKNHFLIFSFLSCSSLNSNFFNFNTKYWYKYKLLLNIYPLAFTTMTSWK